MLGGLLSLLLTFLLQNTLISTNGALKSDSEIELWTRLIKNHNRDLRPVLHANDTVEVQIAPVLTTVVKLDERNGAITLSLTFLMRWPNPFLAWNDSDVDSLIIPCRHIWMPDITQETLLELHEHPDRKHIHCQVLPDGMVSVQFNQIQKSICELSVFGFPFDSQVCVLDYTSWMYPDTKVQIVPMETDLDRNDIVLMSELIADLPEWKVLSYKSFTKDNPEQSKSRLQYELELHRRPMYYILNVVFPTFFIASLSILGLFSPSEGVSHGRNEKISMGLTCLLTMSVMLVVVSDQLPKTTNGSLLGMFIIFEFFHCTIATVVATKMVYYNLLVAGDKPLPVWMRVITGFGDVEDDNREIKEHEEAFGGLRHKISTITGKKITDNVLEMYNNNLMATLLDQCLSHLVHVRQFIDQTKLDAEELEMRSKALNRFEMMMLFLFLALNILVLIGWFLYGCLTYGFE